MTAHGAIQTSDHDDLRTPDTPFAVVDLARVRRNIDRLRQRLDALGVTQRPHVKTAKCPEITRLITDGNPGPVTVSTLAEAEAYADDGYTDILYGVGIDPQKLPRVVELLRRGVTVSILLDSIEQAQAVNAVAIDTGIPIPTFIEVDCDGHRGGVMLDGPQLLAIGRTLAETQSLTGVLVHAGESYFSPTHDGQRSAANHERDVAVAAAKQLRVAGLHLEHVSVGATPTAHAAEDLTGVTEVRAGNYVFFDLVMAGIGVCSLDDLALSVVVTVIGHRHEHGRILTDGGWMAMSRDRGTADQAVDQGYGLVATLSGQPIPQLLMTSASQEHGVLATRDGSELPDLPIGTRLRILPNHACATGAQHAGYVVIDSETDQLDAVPRVRHRWQRITGW
jgi:D-serine deaminase-like pyridoxal phosphate-dependent protein